MKCFYDLHIHSCLSPCADNDMTPNNIVNMALIKGLDIIAVSDHNTAENLASIMKCAEKTDLTIIPAMEVETQEEVHVLCLFPSLEISQEMSEIIRDRLPKINNRSEIFGDQLLMDENDNPLGAISQMLVTSTDISIENLSKSVSALGGVAIPAHVDRTSYSILSNLGFMPENFTINAVEISRMIPSVDEFIGKNTSLKDKLILRNSDAHNLASISEPEFYFELPDKRIDTILRFISNHNNHQ